MQIQIRGSAWRAGVLLLQRESLLDAVVDAAPAASRPLLATHGQVAEWVEIAHFDAVTDALMALGGDALVRRLGRLGGRDAQLPPLRAAVRLLGALGAGPHLLFGRLGQLTRHQSRGVDALYTRRGDRVGEVRLDYAGERQPPRSRLVGMAGRFESLLELAGVQGEVGDPVTSASGGTTYAVSWR